MAKTDIGKIQWFDLTVPEAEDIRDFYVEVCGWSAANHDMGGYADYVMQNEEGEPVAGVCHARGVNAKLPAAWMPYVLVEDIDQTLEKAKARGAEIIDDRREANLAIIRDPAGAYIGFWQQEPQRP